MRHWKAVLAILVVAVVLADWGTWLFLCDPPPTSSNGQNGSHYGECSPYRSFVIVPLAAFLWDAIAKHHDIFLVIATVVIAWFTVTLARSTRQLSAAADQQKKDTAKSLRLTRESR